MKQKKILVWFRNDLRLHDNEMLVEAVAKSDSILPVYFFDPRYFEEARFGSLKMGAARAQFLLESVQSLRTTFQNLGGDLLLIHGKPEDHIKELAERFEITEVYHHREVGPEETVISTHVEDLLWTLKINLKHFIGHTLYNKEDLPFPIKDIPDVFAQFKKKTERDAIVKTCFEPPMAISFVDNDDWGLLPDLQQLGLDTVSSENYATGGEIAGLKHLDLLLQPGAPIYLKSTGKSAADRAGFFAKISAWLALGCVSPRKVYWMIKAAEDQYGSNANFNHILLGLLWRDYFRFMFKKHGIGFFDDPDSENLFQELDSSLVQPELEKWKAGITEHPLVDQHMHDLNTTGFISHAARLLVATYLIHIVKIHWIYGAAYFEEKLVDYAPASNWGNWANVAGVGKDLKSKNTFDLEKQIKILETAIPDSPSFA
jgi:deoxyribodipyrimidine photo-lyase